MIAIAIAGAAFTMACQVAGKAVRDALFLSHFGARHLPAMVIAAALSAIILGLVNARLFARYAPGRLIPALMLGSAGLQAVEWSCYLSFPNWTAIAVYIHIVSLGAVITSGFWSVINEQLDPYTAKRNFGRIAAAGTAGGVGGGFAAERLAVVATSESVLLFLCLTQAITGILLGLLPPVHSREPRSPVRATDILRRSAYLRNLTYLVVLGTFAAALLDYVMKAEARHTIGPGEPLLRFFALFHTGTAVLSFLAQTLITPAFLSRWGLGATVSTLPAAGAAGGLIATLTGGLPAIVSARALEAVVRGSLFRAGYELFYTPMPASEKRALKSINDVTVDRLGDGLGGGFAQLIITTAPAFTNSVLLAAATAASGAGWMVASRLHRGYIQSLERSLRHRAADLEEESEQEAPLPPAGPITSGIDTQALVGKPIEAIPAPPWLPPHQPWTDILMGDRERVRQALANTPSLHRSLLPYVVPMLGRRSVSQAAQRALETVAPANVGLFSDYLLDHSTPVAVRCKLPRVVACAVGPRAFDALLRGLQDDHFEVRVECGRALQSLRRATGVDPDPERVYEAVRQALEISPDLEHVFALIGVILPAEPVRVAFEALGTDDAQLRGLAFEYLESALPPDVSKILLEAVRTRTTGVSARRPADLIRQDLLSAVPSPKGRIERHRV